MSCLTEWLVMRPTQYHCTIWTCPLQKSVFWEIEVSRDWRYFELGRYGKVVLVCLKKWFTKHIRTITNHVSQAYCVKIHCQNGRLRNYVCTALRPILRWREVQKSNFNASDFFFSDIEICTYFTLPCKSPPSLDLLLWIDHHIVPQYPGTCVPSLQLLSASTPKHFMWGVWSSCSHCI